MAIWLNDSDPKQGTVEKWRRALEAAGVKFIEAEDQDGPGVRLKGRREAKRAEDFK